MTQPVRFIVAVNQDWTVTVDGPVTSGSPGSPPPRLWPLPGADPIRLWPTSGPAPAPDSAQADAFLYQLWQPGMSPDIPDLYRKIFDLEQYTRQDAEQLGRFLFDRLVGIAAWNAVRTAAAGSDVIELALRFDGARCDLHRFPWELMHGPDGFLAQGAPGAAGVPGVPPASVTRLVSRSTAPAAAPAVAFQSPPRLLFVVGTRLTDGRVRPGAEIVGLLRQLGSRGLTANTRALLSASPEDLRRAIGDFGPDLVHFTCHGEIEDDDGVMAGFLEFQSEDAKQGAIHRHAAELLGDLAFAGRVPSVVVLSACYSGATPGDTSTAAESWRVAGADRIGSLAAQLVAGGVPIVVGMGGKVADTACRLFTRFFGEALLRGDPLVAAVARGRRGAFLDGVPGAVDWAFPVLFLDAQLDPACAPAARPPGQPDPAQALAGRIQAYNVPKFPVFCGRQEAFNRYHQLFQPGEPRKLAICSRLDGLGRTRLLLEFAAQALRDGHIPCLVLADGPGWPTPPFTGAADLAVEILRAIDRAREKLGLPLPLDSSVLAQLINSKNLQHLKARLPAVWKRSEFLAIISEARASAGDVPSDDVCRAALQEDFQALIEEARHANPPLAGPAGRVLLLLDDVHRYDKAIRPLFHSFIQDDGLGKASEPVPVIACYALGTPNDSFFTEAKEVIGNRELELKPFSPDEDEDLLAYEQVLLFPDAANHLAIDATTFLRAMSGKTILGKVASYAINHRADKKIKECWSSMFRWKIKGIPEIMRGETMYATAAGACLAGFLDVGDDEDKLTKI